MNSNSFRNKVTYKLSRSFKKPNLDCIEMDGPDDIVIYKALCFNVAQGRMNGVPNETRNHSWRFASLAC